MRGYAHLFGKTLQEATERTYPRATFLMRLMTVKGPKMDTSARKEGCEFEFAIIRKPLSDDLWHVEYRVFYFKADARDSQCDDLQHPI